MAANPAPPDSPAPFSEDYAFEYLLPFPIADLFRRFRVSRRPVDQLGYLLSAAEASLKFLVATASSLAAANSELASALEEIGQAVGTPSFGTWRRMLEVFAKTVSRSPQSQLSVDLQRCVVGRSGKETPYLQSVRTLVELRNDYIHGGTMTDAAAMSLLPTVVPTLRSAFREILFLIHYPFVVTEEVQRLRFPACFEVVVRRCQGSNPTFPYEVWRLEESVDPEVPLLLAPDLSEAYRLHPIVAIFGGERFSQPRCCFYLRRRAKAYWHSYERGEPQAIEGPSGLQDEMQLLVTGRLENQPITLRFYKGQRPVWARTLASAVSDPLKA